MQTANRIAKIEQSEATKLTSIVAELRSQGTKVADLSAGEPDFETPQHVLNAAKRSAEQGGIKYGPVPGAKELRKAIAAKLKQDNKAGYEPENVIVANGAKQAVYSALQATCNPGDEVIILSPFWASFHAQAVLAGATPVTVESTSDVDLEAVSKAVTEKTKAIIVNSPNNPSGAVYSKKKLKQLAELAISKNLFVISDEVYEKFCYDAEHFSIASASEEAKARTITVNSFSKTYCMTGFRIGYLAAPTETAQAVTKLQSHLTGNASTLAQDAALAALQGPQDCVKKMVGEFAKRRDYLASRLSKTLPEAPKGAFYAFPDVSSTSKDSAQLCKELLEKNRVALVPGSAFGMKNRVRISYAASMEDVKAAADALEAVT